MSAESWQQVHLSTDLFRKALDRYIDCNKPDPISRKQLEGWSMEWHDTIPDVDNKEGPKDHGIVVDPSHKLHGRLEIGGEFLLITLQISCAWKATNDSSSEKDISSSPYGHFVFACHAKARFWTKTELLNKVDNGTTNKKDQKIQDKIQKKMMGRLRDDAYISKLLQSATQDDENDDKTTRSDSKGGSLVAQADIQFSPNNLEERVTVSDDVCEGIKRAIWSSTESPLDVVELLLSLPLLPTTDHDSPDDDAMTMTTTSLANRAKLRLLEDAMCEACEKEGEDELLDDLTISDSEKKGNENEDVATREVKPPKTKKSKSMPRKKA